MYIVMEGGDYTAQALFKTKFIDFASNLGQAYIKRETSR